MRRWIEVLFVHLQLDVPTTSAAAWTYSASERIIKDEAS